MKEIDHIQMKIWVFSCKAVRVGEWCTHNFLTSSLMRANDLFIKGQWGTNVKEMNFQMITSLISIDDFVLLLFCFFGPYTVVNEMSNQKCERLKSQIQWICKKCCIDWCWKVWCRESKLKSNSTLSLVPRNSQTWCS